MHRILITTALALVFGTSAYMSVYGLAAVFAAHLAVVVCMGIGMELGKLLVVVHLHRRWGSLAVGGRVFYLAVAAALVLITACEITGFLAQSHAVTGRDLAGSEAALAALDREAELLARKIEVTDATLAGLPAGYVSRRIAEREKAGYEAAHDRLLVIARQRAVLTAEVADKTAQAGPVFAVARLVGMDASRAATIFILVLVAVLEPLSMGLAVAASAAWMMVPGGVGRRHGQLLRDEAATRGDDGMRLASFLVEKPEKAKRPEPFVESSKDGRGEPSRPFLDIVRENNLTAKEVAEIVGHKRPVSVEAWMAGDAQAPRRVVRALRRWEARAPAGRLRVVNG